MLRLSDVRRMAHIIQLQACIDDRQMVINTLQNEIQWLQEARARELSQVKTHIAQIRRNAEDERLRSEDEKSYQDSQRQKILRELEDARAWRDYNGEERALDRLKRLG